MIDDSAVYGFLDEYKLRCGITERYIDLSSEVGELGKELLKATDYGKVDFRMTADRAGAWRLPVFPHRAEP